LGGSWCLAAVSPLMSQQYEKAVPLLRQGITISEETDFYTEWLCHYFLGFAYGAQRQWNLAEKSTGKAIQIAKENMEPNSSNIALSSVTMAAIYFDQKRLSEAQPLAMIGVDILENRLKPKYYGPPFLLDLLILGNHILGQSDKVAALVKTRIKMHGFNSIFSQMLENLGMKIR
jgi:tetratricopeptide (TPR) repeat protein